MAKTKLTLTGEITVECELQGDGTVSGKVIGVITGNLPIPGITEDLIILVVTDELVTMAWTDRGDASSWAVYRDDVEIATVAVATYTDNDVDPDTEYTYKILASNDFGDAEDFSDPVTVTTSAPDTPEVPTGFELVTLNASTIAFIWQGSALVAEYDVLRDGVLLDTVLVAAYNDTTVAPSTSYSYTVIARNADGDSAPSDPFVQLTPANTPPEWLIDTTLEGTVGVAFNLDLNTVSTDADGHTRTYSLASGSFPTGITLNGSILQGTPTAANTFAPVLRVSDGIANTDVTLSWVIAAAADTTAPTVPGSFAGSATGSTVTLTWTASTDASGIRQYRIRRDDQFIGAVPSTALTFVQSGVPDGTYSYTVRAEDLANFPAQGNFSANTSPVVVVVASATNPDTPINFAAVWATATQINLSWSPGPSGPAPTDYEIGFSTTAAGGPFTDLPVGLATSISHTGRTNVQHWYRIRAFAGALASPNSTVITVLPQSGAARIIHYDGTLRDGRTNSRPSLNSGGRFGCKFNPEGGINTWADPAHPLIQAGCVSTQLDQHVIGPAGETYDGHLVPPRFPGTNFMRQVLFYNKEYEVVNNHVSPGAGVPHADDSWDKSRCYWGVANTAYDHSPDREWWVGMSIYLHPNHVHDQNAPKAHQGGPAMTFYEATDNFSYMIMNLFIPPANRPSNYTGPIGGTAHCWNVWYMVNPFTVNQASHAFNTPNTHWINVGRTTDDEDIGKWTDFVMRYRMNPFTTNTNAASLGGRNHVYEGNKGIFQMWKSKGPYLDANRNRQMVKVVDIFNAPFGCVPHATANVEAVTGGVYHYGWKKNATSSQAPRYYGRAMIRTGARKPPLAGEIPNQSGTRDIDVNPSGLPLPGWVEQT